MCGINGWIDFKKSSTIEYRHKVVHEMNEKILHRGPNSEGIYEDDWITMGMRRLSIIDLMTGEQPIYNENKTIAVVFNGEIYNYRDLKDELLKLSHVFYTNTDTEVIVHGYEEYGVDVFTKLDGMFAIAIRDLTRNELIIARDRTGEKPLYYYIDEHNCIFGSELKSMISTDLICRDISLRALNQYMQLGYIPAPLSIFKNVYKLKPAHYLIISEDGSYEEKEYWNLQYKKKHITYEEAVEELKTILYKSVNSRMVSDVPIGAFLSGGIDSSGIVGIMSQISDHPINTFTIGFKEKEYDERNRAKIVAKHNKTNHHEFILDYNKTFDILDNIVNQLDEPFADPSVLPTYCVSEFASKYVKVVLTGDAGDELFAGYNKYLIEYYSRQYKRIPKLIQKKIIEPIIYHMPDNHTFTRKVRKVIANTEKSLYEQRLDLMCNIFKPNELKNCLINDYYTENSLDFIYDLYHQENIVEELDKTQLVDLQVVLEGDMLAKVDRMSMLNSIETRSPLLSKDIIEFSTAIPSTFKLKGRRLKCILKDAMASVLPNHFDKYPKSGFGVPLEFWFRNQMRETIEKTLEYEKIKRQGIFNADYVHKVITQHMNCQQNRKNEIWAIYVFQKWYDNIITESL